MLCTPSLVLTFLIIYNAATISGRGFRETKLDGRRFDFQPVKLTCFIILVRQSGTFISANQNAVFPAHKESEEQRKRTANRLPLPNLLYVYGTQCTIK